MKPKKKRGSQDDLINEIMQIVQESKKRLVQKVSNELLLTYWLIGKSIKEREDKEQHQTKQLILDLSTVLTEKLGRGYSRTNLFYMRTFYLKYPNVQTVSERLSWSHICELMMIEDKAERNFYEQETLQSKWSVRELKRQIDSSLFQRLLLSKGDLNQRTVYKLSQEGQTIEQAGDIIKEPYVLEFLGIPQNKVLLEKDLEQTLIRHIEYFLLELGRGFMFVGSQQRVTLGNTHHYVDMVFYNKILRAYVLIDLKMKKLTASHVGQMNAYLNYYKTEINEEIDHAPIGIILCKNKDDIVAEYALGGLNNQIFASKYVYYLPNKDELINQVERALKAFRAED